MLHSFPSSLLILHFTKLIPLRQSIAFSALFLAVLSSVRNLKNPKNPLGTYVKNKKNKGLLNKPLIFLKYYFCLISPYRQN